MLSHLVAISLLYLKLTYVETVQQESQPQADDSPKCDTLEFRVYTKTLSDEIKNKIKIPLKKFDDLLELPGVNPKDPETCSRRLNAGIDLLVAVGDNGQSVSENLGGCVRRYLVNQMEFALQMLEEINIGKFFKDHVRNMFISLKTDLQLLAGKKPEIKYIMHNLNGHKQEINRMYKIYSRARH